MVEREKCCGCSACFNICPQKCIAMMPDILGFLYPVVDEEKCVHCKLCEKVCPVLACKVKEAAPQCAWGGFAIDSNIRRASSSGGIFTLLAKSVLRDNGIVCGAAFNEHMDAVGHVMVIDEKNLYKLQGSKYVQSSIGNIYPKIKEELFREKKVLFSGTPCQIEGLNLFLGHEYNNLITVEIICHGTPSPKLLSKYIKYMENKLDDKISRISFRDEVGGENLIMRIETEKGYVYKKDKFSDPYYRMFLSNTVLRESCYQCPSRGLNNRADITISDFWGAKKVAPDLIDGKGLSLVITHTEKGKGLFVQISDEVIGRSVDFEKAIKGNPSFFTSYNRPELRSEINLDIDNMNFQKLLRKYAREKHYFISTLLRRLNLFEPVSKIWAKIKHC